MHEPIDPFEITQRDPSESSLRPPDSPSLQSPASTVVGGLIQWTAVVTIGAGWLLGKVPVAWHALLAIVVASLRPDVVLQLGKWLIKLAARMRGK